MLGRIRKLPSGLAGRLRRHPRALVIAVVLLLAAGAGAWYLLAEDSDDGRAAQAPAPDILVREVPPEEELETEDLGFPAFATKNTTRVGGPDTVANAAGVALAVHPAIGGVPGPDAVTLVDARDWRAGIAAASLAADPVGAPILLTETGELPALTEDALSALDPQGSGATGGEQVFILGEAAVADGFESKRVDGANPAELAAEVDRLRQELAGEPDHVLLAPSDEPAFAMPAAGWAARSGDPVLFVQRDSLPDASREALERHEGTPVYVLGPESAISEKALREVEEVAPNALRVGDAEPVESSIAFARYADGTFGWNINDPGHGFVIVNAERPLDAAVAAPLSASGSWGPQLVTEEAETVPAQLRGYLLDLKPGYEADPTRAVYNHVWLIGDQRALSVAFQAQVDELAEVAPVSAGAGGGG